VTRVDFVTSAIDARCALSFSRIVTVIRTTSVDVLRRTVVLF